MIVVAGGVPIQPAQREAAVQAVNQVVAETVKEEGCITYRFFSAVDDPNYFHVFEEWDSQEALDRHLKTAHVAAFFAALPTVVAGEPHVSRYLVEAKQGL